MVEKKIWDRWDKLKAMEKQLRDEIITETRLFVKGFSDKELLHLRIDTLERVEAEMKQFHDQHIQSKSRKLESDKPKIVTS